MLKAERAVHEDLEQLLEIAAARRQEYALYQPQFWRPAADAVTRQREFVASQIESSETLVVVARDGSNVRGFAIARTVVAPPVYNPGGLTCSVDDFAVADPAAWPIVGPLLIKAIRAWGADNGATQVVIVVAHLDEPKRSILTAAQLSIASEWWVGPCQPPPSAGP